ncbi:uncharacterized protein G2W53_025260 [Senna tora]|uniref:Uncharacterized protein n=1 Tax=Senna tora TaxID=362788 RepID=A0A834TF43_9FABA|nr:uncharacterized protein G2W53_025260 [Senna tora]
MVGKAGWPVTTNETLISIVTVPNIFPYNIKLSNSKTEGDLAYR